MTTGSFVGRLYFGSRVSGFYGGYAGYVGAIGFTVKSANPVTLALTLCHFSQTVKHQFRICYSIPKSGTHILNQSEFTWLLRLFFRKSFVSTVKRAPENLTSRSIKRNAASRMLNLLLTQRRCNSVPIGVMMPTQGSAQHSFRIVKRISLNDNLLLAMFHGLQRSMRLFRNLTTSIC